jgi:mono/diheme cytochrome c family protein
MAVGLQLALEMLVGAILSLFYSDTTANAYGSTVAMHERMRLLQSFHYWDSALLIVESLGLLAWLLWTGRYGTGFRSLFWSSLFLFLSAYGFQVSGNLLPFDRHGVETALVESGIAARAPAVGTKLQAAILDGTSFSADTLSHWYGAHIALSVLALLALGLAFRGRRGLTVNRKSASWTGAALVFAIGLAATVASPLGSAATQGDYSSYGAEVSWYTWPLHGSMTMLEKAGQGLGWIGAMVIPGLLILALAALPLFGDRVGRRITQVGMALIAVFFCSATLIFGGSFAPLTGTRNPALLASSDGKKASPINAALQAQGAKLFASQGCSNCHGANGDAGGGGPALKTVGLKHADSQYYERYVHNPAAVDPQSTMPAFPNLSENQLAGIAEFLRAKR